MEHIDEKFYGRLKTREITERQKKLFETLFNDISIESMDSIVPGGRIFLEIGFGGGEHIAQMAMSNPDALFIGSEPFINGVAALLDKINTFNIPNIKIFKDDVRKLLPKIPNGFLDGVFLLFPDPWPKRKHFKRRFIQDKTIREIHRIMKESGVLKIATDHPGYQKWVIEMFAKHSNLFDGTFVDSASRPDENSWPKTRYEQKATENIIFASFFKK